MLGDVWTDQGWSFGAAGGGAPRIRWYRRSGDGPTLVLAHGITDSAACWSSVVEALPGVDIVAYDARGHGQSDHAGSYAYRNHVADLTALLERVANGPVVLVGHSMAGPHTAAVAAAFGERVRALVLVDPHWPERPESADDDDLQGWMADIARDARAPVAELVARAEADHPMWSDLDRRTWAAAKTAVDQRVATWLESDDDINAWRDVVAAIECPTLLFIGDSAVDDNVTVRTAGAEDARRLNRHVTTVGVPGAGHSIHRDAFEVFMRSLTAFLGPRGLAL